jgi:hypothetical protein
MKYKHDTDANSQDQEAPVTVLIKFMKYQIQLPPLAPLWRLTADYVCSAIPGFVANRTEFPVPRFPNPSEHLMQLALN